MNPHSSHGHLFQFELAPISSIEPWGNDKDGYSLSLYALTDGHFSVSVGNENLLQYTPEIVSRWHLSIEYANYQVACFARDILELVSAATSPIPKTFEAIVRDGLLFRRLKEYPNKNFNKASSSSTSNTLETEILNLEREYYKAFRWLGERSIWLNYLKASPDIWFVRLGDEIWIQWDNVFCQFECVDVWTARRGTYVLSVEAFIAECHSFSERLLSAMEYRVLSIESGYTHPKISLDASSLRKEFLEFKSEFEKSLSAKYEADIDWEEAKRSIMNIAHSRDIVLPEDFENIQPLH